MKNNIELVEGRKAVAVQQLSTKNKHLLSPYSQVRDTSVEITFNGKKFIGGRFTLSLENVNNKGAKMYNAEEKLKKIAKEIKAYKDWAAIKKPNEYTEIQFLSEKKELSVTFNAVDGSAHVEDTDEVYHLTFNKEALLNFRNMINVIHPEAVPVEPEPEEVEAAGCPNFKASIHTLKCINHEPKIGNADISCDNCCATALPADAIKAAQYCVNHQYKIEYKEDTKRNSKNCRNFVDDTELKGVGCMICKNFNDKKVEEA